MRPARLAARAADRRRRRDVGADRHRSVGAGPQRLSPAGGRRGRGRSAPAAAAPRPVLAQNDIDAVGATRGRSDLAVAVDPALVDDPPGHPPVPVQARDRSRETGACARGPRRISVPPDRTRTAGGGTHARSSHGRFPAVHDPATPLIATGSARSAVHERRLPCRRQLFLLLPPPPAPPAGRSCSAAAVPPATPG